MGIYKSFKPNEAEKKLFKARLEEAKALVRGPRKRDTKLKQKTKTSTKSASEQEDTSKSLD